MRAGPVSARRRAPASILRTFGYAHAQSTLLHSFHYSLLERDLDRHSVSIQPDVRRRLDGIVLGGSSLRWSRDLCMAPLAPTYRPRIVVSAGIFPYRPSSHFFGSSRNRVGKIGVSRRLRLRARSRGNTWFIAENNEVCPLSTH